MEFMSRSMQFVQTDVGRVAFPERRLAYLEALKRADEMRGSLLPLQEMLRMAGSMPEMFAGRLGRFWWAGGDPPDMTGHCAIDSSTGRLERVLTLSEWRALRWNSRAMVWGGVKPILLSFPGPLSCWMFGNATIGSGDPSAKAKVAILLRN